MECVFGVPKTYPKSIGELSIAPTVCSGGGGRRSKSHSRVVAELIKMRHTSSKDGGTVSGPSTADMTTRRAMGMAVLSVSLGTAHFGAKRGNCSPEGTTPLQKIRFPPKPELRAPPKFSGFIFNIGQHAL